MATGLTAGITLTVFAWLLRSASASKYTLGLQVYGAACGMDVPLAVLMDVQTVARNTAGFNDYSIALGRPAGWGSGYLWFMVGGNLINDLFVPWRGIGHHHISL